MFIFAQTNFGKEEGNALVMKHLQEHGLSSTTGMMKSVYGAIMEALHKDLENAPAETGNE